MQHQHNQVGPWSLPTPPSPSGNSPDHGGKPLLAEIIEGSRMHDAHYLPRAVGNGEDCYICETPSSGAAGGVLPLGCSCQGRLAHAHFECQRKSVMQAEQSTVETDGYTADTTVSTCASCQDAFAGAMLIGLLETTAALAKGNRALCTSP